MARTMRKRSSRTMLRRERHIDDPVEPQPDPSHHPTLTSRRPVGRVATERQRNLVWLLGGVLLVLVCALGGVLLVTSTDDRVDAVVASRDLEAGTPVARSDLRVVRIAAGPGVATVTPQAAADLIGQAPIGRVPEGALISSAMFSSSPPLGRGEVVFGAALDPGEAPSSAIDVGAPVMLIRAAATPAGSERPARADVLGEGRVWATEPLGTGQMWITVRAREAVALESTQAAQDDALRVVLVGAGG